MRIHSVVFGLCARESLMILNNIMLCLKEKTIIGLQYFCPPEDHSDSRTHRTAVRPAVFSPRKRPF